MDLSFIASSSVWERAVLVARDRVLGTSGSMDSATSPTPPSHEKYSPGTAERKSDDDNAVGHCCAGYVWKTTRWSNVGVGTTSRARPVWSTQGLLATLRRVHESSEGSTRCISRVHEVPTGCQRKRSVEASQRTQAVIRQQRNSMY